MPSNKAKLEALLNLINSAAQEAIAEYERAGGDVPSIDSAEPHPLDDAVDQVALKSAIRILEGACAQLCATLAPPSHTAVNLVQTFDYACVRVALRENITDILVNHPHGIHVDELSEIVKMGPDKLARILRLLATRGCYSEVKPYTFTNNRLSLVLHSENPVRYVLAWQVEVAAKGALALHETMKDPKTAYSKDPEHAPVMYTHNQQGKRDTFFDLMKQNHAGREGYNQAMQGLNRLIGSLATLTQFPFEKYTSVVDVAGGVGAATLPLAKMYKHIKITVQDLPEVLDQARRVWEGDYPRAIQENRIEFIQLDFFAQAPVQGKDIYYLRNVIHDWPDHEATQILRNVRKALGPHSRVLIHDIVLCELCRKGREGSGATSLSIMAPEPLLPNFGVGNIRMYQVDLTMLIVHNAKERMLQESLKLAAAADLKLEKVWDLAETCIIEYSAAPRAESGPAM